MLKQIVVILAVSSVSSLSARGDVSRSSLEFLDRLVKINSHSHNPAGIRQVREILVKEFEKLGFKARFHALEKKHGVTSFDFPKETPHVLLLGHLDTVFPQCAKTEGIAEIPTENKEDRIYGPGIIDMKGGIVVMLKALESLSREERKKIRVLLNDDEELASVYSREKIRELAQGIHEGLVFEPGLPDGSLVTSASGGRWIKLSVKGKAAHAGLEHSQGLNACTELAHHMIRLHSLTDYSKRLTLNVGVIEGGTQPNVVCEEASVKIDVRYVDPNDLNELLQKIEKVSQEIHLSNAGSGLKPSKRLETLAVVPSMPEDSTRELFALVKEVGEKFGHPIQGQHVGYATDGNHLVQTGMRLLVGLGPYGGGMHTGQEFLLKKSLEERIWLSTQLIREILTRRPQETSRKTASAVSSTADARGDAPAFTHYRIRSFQEVMFPSLGNGDRFVPRPSGEPFVPAFLSG